MIASCTCPGYEAVFECTVDYGVTTAWRGSALENCSHGTIFLHHSKFDEGHTINETCGTSGQVVGRTISDENGSYVSQLTILINQELHGSTLECASDDDLLLTRDSIQVLLTSGT